MAECTELWAGMQMGNLGKDHTVILNLMEIFAENEGLGATSKTAPKTAEAPEA